MRWGVCASIENPSSLHTFFPSSSEPAILAASDMPQHFRFSNLRELLAKANEEKSGDQLAAIAASSERERIAAKSALADLPLFDLLNDPVVPPEEDEVSRLILESHDSTAFERIRRPAELAAVTGQHAFTCSCYFGGLVFH